MGYIINTANPNYCKYGLKAILIATAIVQLIIANKHIIPKIGIRIGKVIATQKATTHGITIIVPDPFLGLFIFIIVFVFNVIQQNSPQA